LRKSSKAPFYQRRVIMLEFIVLGQIPGSHFQLTYGQFIATCVAFFVAVIVVQKGRVLKQKVGPEVIFLLVYISISWRKITQ